ncbi:hypothetical protein OAG63_00525 [Methylacidiphilales bacterium]|nr:hypothetical protein [Candidatus Methylacidiphilales bacterium]
MSVNEILAELEKLSPDELRAIEEKLSLLHGETEVTPEMLEAIDVGLRSLREEPTMTLEELRKEMKTWTTDLK